MKTIADKWHERPAIPMRRMFHDGNDANRAARGSLPSKDPRIYRRRAETERHYSRKKKRVFRLGEGRTRKLVSGTGRARSQ